MTKRQERIEHITNKYKLITSIYYTRKKDWLAAVKAKAPGAFIARWYSGFGWGFIGYNEPV